MEDEVGMESIALEFLGRSKESAGTRDNSPTATPCKIKYLVMKCWLTKPQSTRRNVQFVCCSQSFVLCFSWLSRHLGCRHIPRGINLTFLGLIPLRLLVSLRDHFGDVEVRRESSTSMHE